ncbi:MAG: hypothetical protein A2W17_04610 [Planctomycetes bacterium RBG_16_41_13]|nr:MAG: hypothetical protein A2W17_04610 [Planctomycetes bacterium RBG_16_41_13]
MMVVFNTFIFYYFGIALPAAYAILKSSCLMPLSGAVSIIKHIYANYYQTRKHEIPKNAIVHPPLMVKSEMLNTKSETNSNENTFLPQRAQRSQSFKNKIFPSKILLSEDCAEC